MGRAPSHKEENWIVSGQNLIALGFVIFGDKIWDSGWTLELTIATIEKRRTLKFLQSKNGFLRSVLQTDVKL